MQMRIEAGITKGDLTGRESDSLKKELANIRKTEHRMMEDGVLTDKERAKLQARLDKLEYHINKYRNNDHKGARQ